MSRIVTVLSGGMDSAAVAYHMADLGHEQLFLTFNYGQRHKREIEAARRIAASVPHTQHLVFEMQNLGALLGGSALTQDSIAVPHGHYQEETMRATVVPNRNMIMLSIAWGVMTAEKRAGLACGVHAGDHYIYPDCRPEFCEAFDLCARLATVGHSDGDAYLMTPYLNMTKRDIGVAGELLGVPWLKTYSCYEGGVIHCGLCGACTERKEALYGFDPTEYRV